MKQPNGESAGVNMPIYEPAQRLAKYNYKQMKDGYVKPSTNNLKEFELSKNTIKVKQHPTKVRLSISPRGVVIKKNRNS